MSVGVGGRGGEIYPEEEPSLPAAAVITSRVLSIGKSEQELSDNAVYTSKYTILTFLPIGLREQFRRVANIYFLFIGGLMAIGYYTDAFDSAVTPWTTLGPLAFVVSVSLLQEGMADLARHRSDRENNTYPCQVIRVHDLDEDSTNNHDGSRVQSSIEGADDVYTIPIHLLPKELHGSNITDVEASTSSRSNKTVQVSVHTLKRMDIRAGDIVICKNRDIVPVDLVLLASSADQGSAYIETSSIDGETNLKLRLCAGWNNESELVVGANSTGQPLQKVESMEEAIVRVVQCSVLAHPNGTAATSLTCDVANDEEIHAIEETGNRRSFSSMMSNMYVNIRESLTSTRNMEIDDSEENEARLSLQSRGYYGVLTCELPNKSINTFSGKLTLPPPFPLTTPVTCRTIPLNAENILLRGAVLRNTEWVLGVAAYTGKDTKLVMNSFATPSKFSRLDTLANKVIYFILLTMAIVTMFLGIASIVVTDQEKDNIWYTGYLSSGSVYNVNGDAGQSPWPYLPNYLPPPDWKTSTDSFGQMWLLYITLLNNFVPLSLYVTLEIITFFLIYFIDNDLNMYHDETDTPAKARSTIVSDLGQVEYIFSDKTGTLTQNVMRFKRASVDGLVFGAPVVKEDLANRKSHVEDEVEKSPHHPLRALLYSNASIQSVPAAGGLADVTSLDQPTQMPVKRHRLTFNAEIFLRIMSICHTVVVEKEHDKEDIIDVPGVTEVGVNVSGNESNPRARLDTADVYDAALTGRDGAPAGYAYQAESPDEGALVTAAASVYGHQLVNRDSSGVTLNVRTPSVFEDEDVVNRLKSYQTTGKALAVEGSTHSDQKSSGGLVTVEHKPRQERWRILAINKFDSTRKRMSVLVRSPEDLGDIPMVLCKGADSSMLVPGVCCASTAALLDNADEYKGEENVGDDWELGAILGIQSHLGEFASEGLRTLVLGFKFLTEGECESLLQKYNTASSSIQDREEKLSSVASQMESDLTIVGATAIEDKLQKGVPETIANLAKAGIKLWVCTGDKRETAIEIGYSTKVLTPNMSLCVIKDEPDPNKIRVKLCMEFVRLIKAGKLPQYSRRQFEVDVTEENDQDVSFLEKIYKVFHHISLTLNAMYKVYLRPIFTIGCKSSPMQDTGFENTRTVIMMDDPKQRRKAVREMALKVLRDYLKNQQMNESGDLDDGIDGNIDIIPSSSHDEGPDTPSIFNRSSQAKAKIRKSVTDGHLVDTQNRSNMIVQSTSEILSSQSFTDGLSVQLHEDELSLLSFLPDTSGRSASLYDVKNRTLLEKLFATDAEVRAGLLGKHLRQTPTDDAIEANSISAAPSMERSAIQNLLRGPRALIIEGHALDKLLLYHDNSLNGVNLSLHQNNADPIIQEILFSVASQCDAVIACRVSPAQKAELVKLVRTYVSPEPVTLAIGDGANDVGMIQEAHVGIGISGLEGQQAVNSSDFAIAQFRFLEDLLLVHGRWNFSRMSKVVLFSFYKNAVLVGLLVIYATRTLYSGTPLFDQWVYSMFNFVATIPILFSGVFDRDLEPHYVKRHPEVYAPGPRNEDLCVRVVLRWALFTFIHCFMIYFLCGPCLIGSGGYTSAFHGLMKNESVVGDGEGGDLKVFGLVVFTVLVFHLMFKALYESKSIILGKFPACIGCLGNRETENGIIYTKDDRYFSRLNYTFLGISVGSIFFYIAFLYIYQAIAIDADDPSFTPFVGVTTHTLNTRSITWVLVFMVPVATMSVDVAAKMFGNMYYPHQTQIHMEIAGRERQGKAAVGLSELPRFRES